MFRLYNARKLIACLLPACLVVLVIYASRLQSLQIKPVYDDSTVEIALIDAADLLAAVEPTPEPPPPEPEPPVIEPEVVEPVVIEPPKPKPVVKPRPPAPKPVVVKQTIAPLAPAAPAPVAPTAAPAAVVASAPPKPAAPNPAPGNATQESAYTVALRRELEKHKQYPSGREASLQRPHGDVVIWLEVDRSGNVLNSGIESKAPNMLLNRAAQTSLRRVEKVSPFPSEAFSGKDKQRFTATFSYNVE